MSVQDDLTAIQNDLTALTAGVAQAVTDLNNPDPNDALVAALVSALEAAGYTVTAPAPADAPELPEGEVDPNATT
jgi:hypothetical protein